MQFEDYIRKLENGCWRWIGRLNADGYGMWKQQRAHRFSYEAIKGRIPNSLHIHHSCRNKWCVNPEHLEAVTNQKNHLYHAEFLGTQRILNKVPVPTSVDGKLVNINNLLTPDLITKLRCRILSKIDMRRGNGVCWPWKGMIDKDGYGRFHMPKPHKIGKQAYAHRLVYELLIGVIPVGLVLDHTCKNTACVNPDHLEPVSQAENARRSKMAKLTIDDVINIRSSSEPHTVTARKYGLHPSTVCDIRLGNRWS